MKNSQKTRYSRVFSNRLLIIVTLLIIVLCTCTVFGFVNLQSFRLAINQKRWKASEPSAYYMRVIEGRPDGGPWRWEVYVRDGRLVTFTVLQTNETPNPKSWLNPANLTVDQIFSLANRSCGRRGVWHCGLEFDPQFHYPKRVVSYETIILEIEEFRPCKKSGADCPTASDGPP